MKDVWKIYGWICFGVVIGIVLTLGISYFVTYGQVCMESEHFMRLLEKAGYI